MTHNVCCDSYRVHNVTYVVPILGGQVRDVLACYFWDRCSLIGFLVVMSVVVVLVLLFLVFRWLGAGGGGACLPEN